MELHQTRRRWFRFRLRTLLVIVTVLSVPLGWVGWELDQRRREKATIAWVEEMGGEVHFNSTTFYVAAFDKGSWLEKKKNKWFGERVQGVMFFIGSKVNDLSPLEEFKNLKVISLNFTKVSDLSPLAGLKKLEQLGLNGTQVSDLSPLEELKNLETLDLSRTLVSDLSPLVDLKNLESLWLSRRQVSDEQAQELRLALPNCKIQFGSID